MIEKYLAIKLRILHVCLMLAIIVSFTPMKGISQSLAPIGVGNKCPDLTFRSVINNEEREIKLSDYAGKAVIIDFWAPWCGPCLAAFPKLDTLQTNFSSDLQIIPVTHENESYASKTLAYLKSTRKLKHTMSVVNDTLANKLFPHKEIPHYVWIDKRGVIKAITGTEQITNENIARLINNDKLDLEVKSDNIQFDHNRPYFAGGQVNYLDKVAYHSVLTGFIQNPPGGSIRRRNWINCSNHSILHLYKIAFGEFSLDFLPNNRTILKGFKAREDSVIIGRIRDDSDWKQNYREWLYSYEIFLPDSMYTTKEMFKLMQDDLNRYFAPLGISGRKEIKKIPVLTLVRTSKNDKLKSKGGAQKNEHGESFMKLQNMPIEYIVLNLQNFHGSDKTLPIINETKYLDNVDLEINANVTDINAVNRELARYDLQLKKAKKQLPVLILIKRNQKEKPKFIQGIEVR